jgi:hypothetical protein
MPLPPHIDSFQRFNEVIPDHLVASVAFGLFMRSERIWADGQNPEPTETRCRNYHRDYLTNHEIVRYKQNAENLLTGFANGIVAAQQPAFLAQALAAYRRAAAVGHKGFRFWGIGEVAGGAFVWAILLIVLSIIAARVGIDIFEAYKRAAGIMP